MNKQNRILIVTVPVLTFIILACTCGPLSRVQGLAGTAGAVQTELGDSLPTLQAALTDIGPTIEAQLTETGPTLEALQTQGADALPTLEAQLTELAPTLLAGLEGAGQNRQWAARASAGSERGNPEYAARQAIGEPNVPECGDFGTAWASADLSGEQWLRLEYDTPVTPSSIEIHQTYNPGAIIRVEVAVAGGGDSRVVYEADPQPAADCPSVLNIPITDLDLKISEVTLYLQQAAHPGPNEIDAVQLIGTP